MTRQSTDAIVEFYSGGVDSVGRRLDDILAWDDERLEHIHDYIQWVFPTSQPSGVNPFAPLVTDDTARAFAEHDALRDRLRAALDRMLTFYGLRRTRSGVEIDAARFPSRSAVWLHPGNHNHLRLTRIIDSLAALGLAIEARALQRCLLDDVVPLASGRVTARTREFWQRAGRI